MTVYFIQYRMRIKIGYTRRNVHARLREIGAHLPQAPTLLGSIPGGLAVEKHIHRSLAPFRRGATEWFRDCPEVREFIRGALASPPQIEEPRPVSIESLPPKSPAEYGAMLGRLADLLWPGEAISKMADFAEAPVNDVRAWFGGASVPPKLTRQAFAAEVILFCSL